MLQAVLQMCAWGPFAIYICVVGGRRPTPPPPPGQVLLGWLGAAVAGQAGQAAQLGCQRLWIMFLAYAAVWWLFNGLRLRLHSMCQSC